MDRHQSRYLAWPIQPICRHAANELTTPVRKRQKTENMLKYFPFSVRPSAEWSATMRIFSWQDERARPFCYASLKLCAFLSVCCVKPHTSATSAPAENAETAASSSRRAFLYAYFYDEAPRLARLSAASLRRRLWVGSK